MDFNLCCCCYGDEIDELNLIRWQIRCDKQRNNMAMADNLYTEYSRRWQFNFFNFFSVSTFTRFILFHQIKITDSSGLMIRLIEYKLNVNFSSLQLICKLLGTKTQISTNVPACLVTGQIKKNIKEMPRIWIHGSFNVTWRPADKS